MTEGWTLQGVVVLLALVSGIVALLMNQRKIRRENESDAQAREDRMRADINKHNDSYEKRITAAEEAVKGFMKRGEIEAKIEHEKNNRLTAQDGMLRTIDRLTDDVVQIKVDLGRVAQRQDSFASDMAEIKALLKEQTREITAKIEKLSDSIVHK